jgi:hypothetical protein
MRARITQGIRRRIEKLVNPLLDAEGKAAAKSREHVAANKEQQLSIARYNIARTEGLEVLAPSEREKLTKAQRSIIAGMPDIVSIEQWQREAMASQEKLQREVRE